MVVMRSRTRPDEAYLIALKRAHEALADMLVLGQGRCNMSQFAKRRFLTL
jgi:hypothetical protein